MQMFSRTFFNFRQQVFWWKERSPPESLGPSSILLSCSFKKKKGGKKEEKKRKKTPTTWRQADVSLVNECDSLIPPDDHPCTLNKGRGVSRLRVRRRAWPSGGGLPEQPGCDRYRAHPASPALECRGEQGLHPPGRQHM